MTRKYFFLFLFGALFCCTGCLKITAKYDPLPKGQMAKGPVQFVLNDARPEDKGQGKPKVIGKVRNLYGMAFDFKTENDTIEALKNMFSDAVMHSGVQVAPQADKQVVVDVKYFWFDGYMGYKLDSTFDIKVIANGQVVLQKEITRSAAINSFTKKKFAKSFDVYMKALQGDVAAYFTSAEFQAVMQ